MNTTTGELSFRNAQDFESPGDSDSNNDFVVQTTATDSDNNTSTHTVTVNLVDLDDIQFFLPDNYNTKSENISYIPKNQLMMDYIESMDLVISRAGFNTISECIACRTPMLLIGEAMNPEINENIINLKNQGLASFVSLSEFRNDLHKFLPVFIKNEFQTLKYNMKQHELPLDGADVIAKDILNYIN